MSSTSESGHARNVAHFNELIIACQAMGTPYNPSNTAIVITALQTANQTAESALTSVNTNLPIWKLACSQREAAFEPLSALVSRIVNGLTGLGFPKEIVKDAASFARKVQGRKANKSIPIEEENFTRISSSQMSYDNRLGNLERLIEYVTALTGYSPNEPELQIVNLNTLLTTLRTHNSNVTTARLALVQARILRDTTLYDHRTGITQLAKQVKNYVKSAFGNKSHNYNSIKGIYFSRPA